MKTTHQMVILGQLLYQLCSSSKFKLTIFDSNKILNTCSWVLISIKFVNGQNRSNRLKTAAILNIKRTICLELLISFENQKLLYKLLKTYRNKIAANQ